MENIKNLRFDVFSKYESKLSESRELSTISDTIAKDEKLKVQTELYRLTGTKEDKEKLPLFAPSCHFRGGKKLTNIVGMTGYGMVDIDDIEGDIEEVRRKVNASPYTVLSYVTASNHGIRAIFRYHLPPSMTLPELIDYYKKSVFGAVNRYYSQLLGLPYDERCKDATRLSGLAYDPDVFLNPEAVPFPDGEISRYLKTVEEAKRQKREKSRQTKRISSIQQLFDKTLAAEIEKDGGVFAPGHHNDFIMRLGYKLNAFGINLDEALAWAMPRYSAEYEETESVIRSCYGRTEEHGTRKWTATASGFSDYSEKRPTATVKDIKAFLSESVMLRHNVLTGRYEYRMKENGDELFCQLDDRAVNTLWASMYEVMNVKKDYILNVIKSDFTPFYNPVSDYLSSLPHHDTDGRDYIRELYERLNVSESGEEPISPYEGFCRFLVGMIAQWVDDKAENHLILTLIGKQGAGKSTFFNYLLPPQLREHYKQMSTAECMSKDNKLSLTTRLLVNLDDYDSVSPSRIGAFNNMVSTPYIDERRPYAEFEEHRCRRASFCSTGNEIRFITDAHGARRWVPLEVGRIQSMREYGDHDYLFAQIYSLYTSGFKYWFDEDETKALQKYNERFTEPDIATESIMSNFRKPQGEERGEFWLTADMINYVGGPVASKLNVSNMGNALNKLGFEKARRQSGRGYIVVPLSGVDKVNMKKMLVYDEPTAEMASDAPF